MARMHEPSESVRRLPRAGLWLIAALLIVQLLRVPYAATHLDFARDLFVAWRFLHGEEVPLAGPVLAGTLHLGPAWYWLLAALLGMTRSWLGVVLLLGLLSATQVLLAWRVGRALHSERAGLLWAALLALPAWSSFEWMLPQHYVLTTPLVLAFLLCAVRFVQHGGGGAFAGMALSLVLAVHAHPSSIGLAWLALGVFAHALWQRRLRWTAFAGAVALGLLPLLPYLLWSAQNDFADFHAGGAYLSDGRSTGTPATALPLLYQATLGGLHYWLDSLLGWPSWALLALQCVLGALLLAAGAGLLQLYRDPARRPLLWLALAAVAAIALTTALIRSATPYYMTTPLRVVGLGALALGLAQLQWRAFAPWLRRFAIGLALGLNLVCTVAAARFLVAGNWPFDFQALFNVVGARAEPAPLLLLPAYAMRASGEFLCSEPAASVHGAYARHLLYDYAMETRLSCARSDVQVGGADPARRHWLGLSRQLARQAGLAPDRRIGSLAVFPVRRVLAGDAFAMPAQPVYPVHLPVVNPAQPRRYALRLAAGERLAVSTMAFFIPAPTVEFIAGSALRLLAEDGISRVYACDGCSGEIEVELIVTTAHFSDTDIVVF